MQRVNSPELCSEEEEKAHVRRQAHQKSDSYVGEGLQQTTRDF